MMPKLKQWAQIAEVVGAIAIIVSLIYVANEVRHNTEATQAATFQQMVQLSATSLIAIASDPDLADLMRRAVTKSEQLTEQERFRLFLITRAQWRGMEAAFFQRQHGVLAESEWQSYRNTMCQELGALLDWENHRPALSRDFVAFIEGCKP